MPEISVIMGLFNGRRYLPATIASLNAQTFTDWELVLVDNGSTDGSAELAQTICPPEKLNLVREPKALGPAGALRRACEVARGRFLAVLDSDDIALPNRFEIQRAFLINAPDVGLLGGLSQLINADGVPGELEPSPCTHDDIFGWSAYVHGIRHSTVFFRRELLTTITYRDEFCSAADMDFIGQAVEHTRAAAVPVVVGQYRLHAGNLTVTNRPLVALCGGLARMTTRRRRLGFPENLKMWSARFRAIETKVGLTEAGVHIECSRIFITEGYYDLAVLHAWHSWRTGPNGTALWLYGVALIRGLVGSAEARRGLLKALIKEPAHRLMRAQGTSERLQF